MGWQLPPELLQRSHWYSNSVGPLVHLPCASVSVLPSRVSPAIVGGASLLGGWMRLGCTTLEALEVAGLLAPPALLAVSWTSIVCPISAAMSLYVCAVAPEI